MTLVKQAKLETVKKVWIRPELEVLDVSETAYWEYVWNPDTQFWQEVWVNES